jgi:hypothetical protein
MNLIASGNSARVVILSFSRATALISFSFSGDIFSNFSSQGLARSNNSSSESFLMYSLLYQFNFSTLNTAPQIEIF